MNINKSFNGIWQPHEPWVNYYYNHTLQNILNSDKLFAKFKSSQTYNGIVGGDAQGQEVGQEYVKLIESEFPHLLEYLEKFKVADTIGSPFIWDYEGAPSMSPGTLMYTYILGDIERHFGPFHDNYKIVEIGGGYGGQCLTAMLYHKFQEYAVVDLELAIELTKKYLGYFDVQNTSLYTTDKLPTGNFNTVVSNFCLTELDDEGIDSYLNSIFINSESCYILSNFKCNRSIAKREAGRQEELVLKLEDIYRDVEVIQYPSSVTYGFVTWKIIGKGRK